MCRVGQAVVTIVVDEIQRYADDQIKPAARRYGNLWCHLFDTENDVEALVTFATDALGMRPGWLQWSGRGDIFPHFDLTPARRMKAILAGAMPVPQRRAGEMMTQMVAESKQFAQTDPRYGKPERIMARRRR
jgi:hypothetical protein